MEGDYLVPTEKGRGLAFKVPRVHSARNIGDQTFIEILFELKDHDDQAAVSDAYASSQAPDSVHTGRDL